MTTCGPGVATGYAPPIGPGLPVRAEALPPRAGIWPLIAATLVANAIWLPAAGLSFARSSALLPVMSCVGLEAMALFYRIRRPEARIAAALDGLAQVIAYCACAGVLSYAVAGTGGPLWDATLHAWDRALGLDWQAYLGFVNDHPRLGFVYSMAYHSLMPQLMLVIVGLSFTGRLRALRVFVLAFGIAATTTIVVSALMPAMENFIYLGLVPADFPNIDPAASYVHAEHLTGLRDGTFGVIAFDRIEGIITFPSLHAALGILFLSAFWTIPSARLPALLLNGLLIAATPIDGGHYFVDVIAGVAVAVVSSYAARRLHRREGTAPPVPGMARRPDRHVGYETA